MIILSIEELDLAMRQLSFHRIRWGVVPSMMAESDCPGYSSRYSCPSSIESRTRCRPSTLEFCHKRVFPRSEINQREKSF
jgi:hypothetical protein